MHQLPHLATQTLQLVEQSLMHIRQRSYARSAPLGLLGLIHLEQGELAAARPFFEDSLRIARRAGVETLASQTNNGFARLLARQGAHVRIGSRQLDRALAVCKSIQARLPQAKVEAVVTASSADGPKALEGRDLVIAAGAAGAVLLPQKIRREKLWQEKTKWFAAAAAVFLAAPAVAYLSVFWGQHNLESTKAIEQQIRWFDHEVRGMENGSAGDPPIQYFVMGAADWARVAQRSSMAAPKHTPERVLSERHSLGHREFRERRRSE